MSAFLDVARSLTGRRWLGPSPEAQRLAAAIAQGTGLPDLVAQVLAARGVQPHDAETWLEPRLRDLMPDPSVLRDLDLAVEILTGAVLAGRRIAIFTDYDVDGAASAALMLDWLRALGHDATLYVPDRIDEGYGPNPAAMARLAAQHDLIVTLDCGTLAHEALAAASGAQVIVIDHHTGGETLPPAAAVVNPNRQDEDGALGHLCAAGVVFLVLVAANRALRAQGRTGPDLMAMLDLVALATVADVAPLTGLNRALVRQGLAVMATRSRPGLVALADQAGLSAAPTAWHLGFALGPRVNAGGRVGRADMGTRLLSATSPDEAAALAEQLGALNDQRRAIGDQVQAAAMAQAETRPTDGPLVWAAGAGWHPGVVGIVAARLKEAFNRPAVVIALDGDIGKGSARSVSGVDLGAAIARLAHEGHLVAGGGHKMAAGLTVTAKALPGAMARLAELLAQQAAMPDGPADLRLDGVIGAASATLDLAAILDRAGPFGAAAPAPRVAMAGARIAQARRMGDTHLSLTLQDSSGRLDAVAFRAFDSAIGPALFNHAGQVFHFAGQIFVDDWGGRRRVRLRLEDAAPDAG